MVKPELYGVVIPVCDSATRTDAGRKEIPGNTEIKLYFWSDGIVTWTPVRSDNG